MTPDGQFEARCHDTDDPGTPQCALPGCRHAVPDPGRPCLCCLAAFGTMLRERSPAADVDGTSQPSGISPHRPVLGGLKPNSAVKAALSGTKERKQNQTCWLCVERRTCTKEEQGWECDECRKIT